MISILKDARYPESKIMDIKKHFFRRLALSILFGLSTLTLAGCPLEQEANAIGFADSSQQPDQYSSSSSYTRPGSRGSKLMARFEQFDRNGDGVLTADEVKRPQLFQRLDQNADGSVTLDEARGYIRSRRQSSRNNLNAEDRRVATNSSMPSSGENLAVARPLSSPELDDDEQQFEPNANTNRYSNQKRGRKLVERFNQLDRNGDGVLTADEVKRPELFQRLDQNTDGSVTLDEARNYLLNQRRSSNKDANTQGTDTVINRPSLSSFKKDDVNIGPTEINQHLNIRYAEIPSVDPNLLSLDIYAPKTGQQYPVIVMIHGGGWQRGDKANTNVGIEKANFFVPLGYIFVSVNYRLSPAVKHPTHAQDIARAISWTKSNINTYGGNPEQLYLLGHSSGAHLAALVALDNSYLKTENLRTDIIKGIILLDGASYDIPKAMQDRNKPELLLTAIGNNKNSWREASPIYHVSKNSWLPPFLIFSAPRLGASKQSESFANAIRREGGQARVVFLDKKHEDFNRDLGLPNDEITIQVIEFLAALNPTKNLATPDTIEKGIPPRRNSIQETDTNRSIRSEQVRSATSMCFEPVPNEIVKDPEFEEKDFLVAWQVDPTLDSQGVPIKSGSVIISPIDPETGHFLLDRKIIFNNSNPINLRYTSNGPEWGRNSMGPVLYFAQYQDKAGTRSQLAKIFRIKENKWSLTSIPNSTNKAAPFASSNQEKTPSIFYVNINTPLPALGKRGSRRGHYWGWRTDTDNNPKDYLASTGARHGRWIPGTRTVVYARASSASNTDGLYAYNTDTKAEHLIDNAAKFKSFAVWRAPENQDEPMIIAQAFSSRQASELRSYAYDSKTKKWQHKDTFSGFNSDYPFPTSPEAFVVNNKSYVAVVSTKTANFRSPGIIWIAAVAEPSFRRIISENIISVKKDPEALSIQGGKEGIIYYVDATQRKFKACYAGLK